MSMVHHDSRPYAVAVSDAAKKFQEKIETMIHGSVQRVTKVIEDVQNDVPDDMVVLGRKIVYGVKDNAITIVPPSIAVGVPNPDPLTVHSHAFDQICERAKIKNLVTVMKEIRGRGPWGVDLVAENLNRIFAHLNGDRFLLRSVRGQLRGFLSDRFRRLDTRPLMDAFVGALRKYGARPVDGYALGTRNNLRAILPYVFEPFPGEIMAFGAQLSNSDFGDGMLTFSGIVLRMWCTNYATTEDVLSQVHLGRKLSDQVEFSQRTLALDTETMSSAIGDVAGHVLSPKAINNYLDVVRAANEAKIEPNAITSWAKKNLTKAETEKAVGKFSSADVELLPPGQTKWRWSNALSWLANETEDEHRKLELQDFAGNLLKPEDKKS